MTKGASEHLEISCDQAAAGFGAEPHRPNSWVRVLRDVEMFFSVAAVRQSAWATGWPDCGGG